MAPFAGGAARRARGRLHRAVDEPVADRGVHPDPADGRHRRPLFREFAVTLSVAILISLVRVADDDADDVLAPAAAGTASGAHGRLFALERARLRRAAPRLRAKPRAGRCATASLMMLVLLATVCLNVYLYVIIPKGFFPQQDTGRLIGSIQADQSISFQAMQPKLAELHRHRPRRSGGRERRRASPAARSATPGRCSSR